MGNLEATIFAGLFIWSFGCRHTYDIVMLLWPLKMLTFNFCNVLDWTGLDLTGTMVDLPDAIVGIPVTVVDLPDTMV